MAGTGKANRAFGTTPHHCSVNKKSEVQNPIATPPSAQNSRFPQASQAGSGNDSGLSPQAEEPFASYLVRVRPVKTRLAPMALPGVASKVRRVDDFVDIRWHWQHVSLRDRVSSMLDVPDVMPWPVAAVRFSRPITKLAGPLPPERIRGIFPLAAPLVLICCNRPVTAAVLDRQTPACGNRRPQEPGLNVCLDISQPDATLERIALPFALAATFVHPLLPTLPWPVIENRPGATTAWQ